MKFIVIIALIVCVASFQFIMNMNELTFQKKTSIRIDIDDKSYDVALESNDTILKILERLGIQASNIKNLPNITSFYEGQHLKLEMKKTTCVSLNTSSEQDLVQIKGIGPRKAEAILKYRLHHQKFMSIDELLNIKGIGPKLLERIKDFVCI
ncbi:ComEA family DNA-binding protein [Erysipelothrix piscisicarius]|uniref:ComEA family DNA-binding protein n=1 Tax=Erysipelothrix piscisicarius TaxID=2485784 RepID=UPI002F95C769